MKKIISVLFLMCLITSGCDITLSSDIKISELLSLETTKLKGNIDIEISSCHDYQDSRIESRQLIELKEKVKNLLPSAEYKECYQKSMNSYAIFSTDISVTDNPDNALISGDITVIRNGKGTLGIHIPQNIIKGLNSEVYNDLKLHVLFNLINDTDKNVNLHTLATFVNDTPVSSSSFTLNPGNKVSIRLSDIWTAMIQEGKNAIFLKSAEK